MSKPSQILLLNVPEGLIVSRKKLFELGFDKPSIDSFLRSGKLETVGHGIYRRPGPRLKWEHIVYSINQLGYAAYVGGRSSLDLQGFAHYLPLSGISGIQIYSLQTLPKWVHHIELAQTLVSHRIRLFADLPEGVLTDKPFGHWDWMVPYATPELALLELLDSIKTEVDLQVADS